MLSVILGTPPAYVGISNLAVDKALAPHALISAFQTPAQIPPLEHPEAPPPSAIFRDSLHPPRISPGRSSSVLAAAPGAGCNLSKRIRVSIHKKAQADPKSAWA
jgi:hypothetical protein